MTADHAQFIAELFEAERRNAADADDSETAYRCARILRSFDMALNPAAHA